MPNRSGCVAFSLLKARVSRDAVSSACPIQVEKNEEQAKKAANAAFKKLFSQQFSFRVSAKLLIQAPEVRAWWRRRYAQLREVAIARMPIGKDLFEIEPGDGRTGPLTPVFPHIAGVPGGGGWCPLASFDKAPSQSFGLGTGTAPMRLDVAERAAATLNWLLRDDASHFRLGSDLVAIFWAVPEPRQTRAALDGVCGSHGRVGPPRRPRISRRHMGFSQSRTGGGRVSRGHPLLAAIPGDCPVLVYRDPFQSPRSPRAVVSSAGHSSAGRRWAGVNSYSGARGMHRPKEQGDSPATRNIHLLVRIRTLRFPAAAEALVRRPGPTIPGTCQGLRKEIKRRCRV